jgi:hypothetical protein
MTDLDTDIAAYEKMRAELETHHKGKWVLFHNGIFVEAFDRFEIAASEAVARFGHGPYLIRQVGASDFVMPASVMYRLASQHA